VIRVWRLEHECLGCGPYNTGALAHSVRVAMADARCEFLYVGPYDTDGDNHPSPCEDGIEDFTDEHFFGFASEDDLYEWFPHAFIQAAAECGYVINAYDVEEQHVIRGESQICFEREKAHIVNLHCASAA
jgi:hypothetical protein